MKRSTLGSKPRRRRLERWAIVLALLALAVGLRVKDLGRVPMPLETADELHYAWCGLSLMADGRPTAWTLLTTGYEKTPAWMGRFKLGKNWALIASPALDHPPLYSLLAGGFAKLTGAAPMQVTTDEGRHVQLWALDMGRCRVLSIILFGVGFLLLYDLAARRCGWTVALTTLALYGTISHVVLHDRLLVTETLSTPIFLGSLCAWERYRLGRWSERRFAVVTILATAAALLVKVIAVSQAAAIVFLLLMEGRRRAALYPILGAILGMGIYCAYGAWQGWGLFLHVLATQAERFRGFDILDKAIRFPQLVHVENFDYPLFLGWIALFGCGACRRPSRGWPLLVAALAYFLAFAFFVPVMEFWGWHLMPFYPFLALGLAIMFCEAYRRPKPAALVTMVALLAPMAFEVLYRARAEWGQWLRLAYLATVAAALCMPALAGDRWRRWHRALLALMLATLILRELWVLQYLAS
jgi:hypothetical protein